ncbi:PF00070 family, FAD-dependent NAD(P)-disulfide oxidoreductase [Acidisarcina polymorpha]|uniref:PF00070 family, FAD-dependent NAD(P)-disulfide oxidoreductase n=1 Tax=Acidisarcina polymorpha TaxID=2211140 RepID=A0A2Z5G8L5_9BACT|nr:FAD-dependent oxidoreductase [Acidisarcina polymorpha]AXC15300.1 PF00070 family, FAD-dependent NAD(P)-disulfide oxidoreductase [Acidisarcina polymorpha]
MESQTQIEDYDLVILGSGAGSKLLAWTFAGSGKRVAVIERKYVGGSCPNIACLPSKNLIHTAQIVSDARRSGVFRSACSDGFAVEMPRVTDRKRTMVKGLVDAHLALYKGSGAELIMGSGAFTAAKTLKVELNDGTTRMLRGENVIIGTGTHAKIDDHIPGMLTARPLTHVEALELDVLPEHLVILGAGYVGLEFAQAMRRLGSRVTVIDHNSHVLHHEDEDVVEGLHSLLIEEGIELVLNAKINGVSGVSGKSVLLHVEVLGSPMAIAGTHLLVAAGRMPNTRDIGLETAGIELSHEGFVKVDDRLRTTAPGVWAVGEVAGSPRFTHVSVDDFRVVHDNLLGGERTTTGRQVPFCLFTDPEFARVGLSEKEAVAKGFDYRLFKIPMAEVLRAQSVMETRGFMKCLVECRTDRILGFSMFGQGAGDVMTCVQITMLGGLPYTALRDLMIAHPTFAEGLGSLFSSVPTSS